jgi:hypothetical protein
MRLFFDFTDGNLDTSVKNGICKPYRLNDRARRALDQIFGQIAHTRVLGELEPSVPIFDVWGDSNGIDLLSSYGIDVPATIPIDLEWLDQVRSEADPRYGTTASGHIAMGPLAGVHREQVVAILDYSRRNLLFTGGLRNRYKLELNGRFGSAGLNLITCPKKLRHRLLAGQNLIDYDRFGFETNAWKDYIKHKNVVHAHWMAITGHADVDDFKDVTAALLTGGDLSCSKEKAIAKLLGVPAAYVLVKDPTLQALYDEAKVGMKALLDQQELIRMEQKQETAEEAAERNNEGKKKARRRKQRTGMVLINAVGAVLPEEANSTWHCRAYAHLIRGYEQIAVRLMCRGMKGLVVIVYDGWISTVQDIITLEALVASESESVLGVRLVLRLKATPLDAPTLFGLPGSAALVSHPASLVPHATTARTVLPESEAA